jgi:hypothetical protein
MNRSGDEIELPDEAVAGVLDVAFSVTCDVTRDVTPDVLRGTMLEVSQEVIDRRSERSSYLDLAAKRATSKRRWIVKPPEERPAGRVGLNKRDRSVARPRHREGHRRCRRAITEETDDGHDPTSPSFCTTKTIRGSS